MELTERSLISIEGLKVHFRIGGGIFGESKIVKAVDGVTLIINRGETLGLVGESGSGKSTLGKAILRLTEPTDGRVFYDGKDLVGLAARHMRQMRKHMQMIFQDPYSSLNPRMNVGQIIGEPITAFGSKDGKLIRSKVLDLMETVGLNGDSITRYPDEFSGGQRQRIGIARALAAEPQFIVADEPLSSLDVSIQAQIMNLLVRLQEVRKITYLFISHDLRAVRYMADRIAVMYLGKIVEIAPAKDLYDDPLMPYTRALISAVPVPDPDMELERKQMVLKGDVPSAIEPPSGCSFHTRCPYAIENCRIAVPELIEIKPGHNVACTRISPEYPDITSVTHM
jgi:oligopeptide/dipeptide ABC transporter, ATP-binding protein, C-terminal domain